MNIPLTEKEKKIVEFAVAVERERIRGEVLDLVRTDSDLFPGFAVSLQEVITIIDEPAD